MNTNATSLAGTCARASRLWLSLLTIVLWGDWGLQSKLITDRLDEAHYRRLHLLSPDPTVSAGFQMIPHLFHPTRSQLTIEKRHEIRVAHMQ